MTEIWRSVRGWEDLYEVSDLGRVRSLERMTERGIRGGNLLKPVLDTHGYQTVTMTFQGKKARMGIHVLVLAAFVGPRPQRAEVAHEDGNNQNNCLDNLSYKSKSGNMLDTVRHGTHRNTCKVKCPRCEGEYSVNYRGQRYCPACRNAYQRDRYAIGADVVLERHRQYREENLERRREIEPDSKRRSRAKKKLAAV